MHAAKPTASLSLDLDNQWSYMKSNGVPGWQAHPSYLDSVVPRILDVLDRHRLSITFFIVGQDAALERNRAALKEIAARRHDIANHSFDHEPSLSRMPAEQVARELARAEEAILEATGVRPTGFRGPSFALSTTMLEVLKTRGYAYDASTFPTFLGPLARRFHFRNSALSEAEKAERALVFGTFGDGFRPLAPFRWDLKAGRLIEIPVTTVPVLRTPFHLTYLSFLAETSRAAAMRYFQGALRMCRLTNVPPSLLLHPLDFIGGDELPVLKGFPGMGLETRAKIDFLDAVLDEYRSLFGVVSMREHARRIAECHRLQVRRPRFETDRAPSAAPA